MSEAVQGRENGYRAFISYSHRDDAAAKSLHKRLETYRLPKKLIGQSGERGPIPERLTPIFRDLDELSAADDLTVEIKAALARSATLIVLCSPGAKASKWVNLEIETFRALHGTTRPVLAALIEGEPADAFPPALIADGQEPVAADFRKNRDGKSLALLKLVAGMAGAPLDALVQRDAQRQYRRVMAITGGALTAALAMALLLVVALRAQSEAERQRQEAEGLVEYMLTDLRDRLKGVGRLDVMTAVNERAMKYYGGNTTKAQMLKAQTLHALGEDEERRGNLKLARRKFDEAHIVTSRLLAEKPNDPERLFIHAQSEYWKGYIPYAEKQYSIAEIQFSRYRGLAKKLLEIDKNSIKYSTELSYAEGNLCTVKLESGNENQNTIDQCKISLNSVKKLYMNNLNSIPLIISLINRNGWLAEAYKKNNEFDKSIIYHNNQLNLSKKLYKSDKTNADFIELLAISQMSIAEMYLLKENKDLSFEFSNMAKSNLDKLVKNDDDNAAYKKLIIRINDIIFRTRRI